jgi:UDP-N-acetylmuramoyl-tripeptide--D-alanyl-D-alanine ligase
MYGIAFHILDLKREKLLKGEWISLFFLTPIRALQKPPKEKYYIVEVDCDRPEEGRAVATFLDPDIVLWVSASRTHTVNFDRLILEKKFGSVEEAVAYEFGYLLEYCKRLVVVNGDNPYILEQLKRSRASVVKVEKKAWLEDYSLYDGRTEFVLKGKKYILPFLLPEETFYAIAMCMELLDYLGVRKNMEYSNFVLPPGRSSVFKGLKETTIIDSTYNATPASVAAILSMFQKYKAYKKWIVFSDMVELGDEEKEEHERLAGLLSKTDAERILLMGPRMVKYTYPKLVSLRAKRGNPDHNGIASSSFDKLRTPRNDIIVERFLTPKEVLDYLEKNLQIGTTILFKGARFLEGVIEHLLLDKDDKVKLPRREEVWERRRKEWGL